MRLIAMSINQTYMSLSNKMESKIMSLEYINNYNNTDNCFLAYNQTLIYKVFKIQDIVTKFIGEK